MYVPAALKFTVVVSALALPNIAAPGPLSWLQTVVKSPAELLTLPCSVVAAAIV